MHSRKKLQKKETSTPVPKKYLEYEVSQRGVVRGSTLKPPTLARHHSHHLHELFDARQSWVRNTELISHHQPEEFRKSQKETPHVLPPPRILLAGIHVG